ncbi:unnamed protein product [Linum trigynum]|uniref:Transmembrane protein n=1 Tax=Linum trigynum TaxID=586398 RepID=A0AAV2E4W5_9ROSI
MQFSVSRHPFLDRYRRPDPLHGFKDYVGTYNVTDKHYWASAMYTGVHGYAIAVAWVICGVGLGIVWALKNGGAQLAAIRDFLDYYHLPMFFLLLIFTVLALAATIIVAIANQSSLHKTEELKGTIVKVAKETHRTIQSVVLAMSTIQSLLRPYQPDTSLRLYNITHLLADDSNTIKEYVAKSSHSMDIAIETSHMVHFVVVIVNLAFLVASIPVLFLHWHPGFILTILTCWILTTMYWILTGVDFFLHTFAEDTCRAFHSFVENPHNNSLSSIIPCMDTPEANELLAEVGGTIHSFISDLNSKISSSDLMFVQEASNVDIKGVCDPFSGSSGQIFTPGSCPTDFISVGEMTNMLLSLTCPDGSNLESCGMNGKVIPKSVSMMAIAYSRSAEVAIDVFPELESLTKCMLVKGTLADVVDDQCGPFKMSMLILWIAMLCVSIFMTIFVLGWVTKSYQERDRRFSACSIWPNLRAQA